MQYSIGRIEDYLDQDCWCTVFRFLDSPLGLFESEVIPPAATDVGPYLRDLLEASEAYPPALALAKEDLFRREFTQLSDIVESVTERLEFYLARQSSAGSVQAKSLTTDAGYRTAGKAYWILSRQSDWSLERSDVPIWWVSWDYEIYMGESCDFQISREQLERLPCAPRMMLKLGPE